jgi:hypothetical protein
MPALCADPSPVSFADTDNALKGRGVDDVCPDH